MGWRHPLKIDEHISCKGISQIHTITMTCPPGYSQVFNVRAKDLCAAYNTIQTLILNPTTNVFEKKNVSVITSVISGALEVKVSALILLLLLLSVVMSVNNKN